MELSEPQGWVTVTLGSEDENERPYVLPFLPKGDFLLNDYLTCYIRHERRQMPLVRSVRPPLHEISVQSSVPCVLGTRDVAWRVLDSS